MRVRKIHVYLTLVLLVLGFLFSYNMQVSKENGQQQYNDRKWLDQQEIQEKLLEEQETNRKYEQQLNILKNKVAELEKQLAERQGTGRGILKELEKYRMISGLMEVTGPGVKVVLNDSKNASAHEDVTNYIVHEQDVRRVVNELFAAGAEAVSINGQRLVSHSAIRCVGPTIIVNGVKSTIPFEITAIGDPDTLYTALEMPGGVAEVLRAWTIQVDITRHQQVTVPGYVGDVSVQFPGEDL
ncbi:MAG: DUF881 domain-containing protein [Bacillaceae bacterium]|nr:DUF881 domain-containing protein [Bacillaceae bacterium]